MNSGSFVRRQHSVGINAFHLEWCPKYRYKVLDGNWLRKVLTENICKTAEQYGIQIFAMEISTDHLHMFVNLPGLLGPSAAINLFKGRSAKAIFEQCPSFRSIYRAGHFWSRGSFYRSVSNVGADTIYRYITEHRSKEITESVVSVEKEFGQMSLVSFY
jgi:putative transposase